MSLPGLFKVSSAYKPTADIETFLGEPGGLFYSFDQQVIVISDGVTPGGNLLNSLRVQNYTAGTVDNSLFTGTLAFDTDNFALEVLPNGTIKLSVIGINGGSNINIKGSLADVSLLPNDATVGDSYLIGNDLHVWQGDVWENVGPIRGPVGFTGSFGYTGSQGDIGYTGSFGYTGSQGDIGYIGSFGYTGSQGDIGYSGSQGDLGFTGSFGYTGSQGDQGYTGSQGDIGYTGSQGDIGYTGSKGDTGLGFSIAKSYISVAALEEDTTPTNILPGQFALIETGNVEDLENSRLYIWDGAVYSYVTDLSGAQGITGPIGYTGSQGDIGYTGSEGYTGSQGEIGYTGSEGYTGSQGDQGYTGSQGEIGYTGSEGYTGSQGEIGYTGSQGDQGYTGSQGEIGYTGSQGESGYTGSQGDPGTSVTIQGSVPTAEDLPNPFGGNIGDGYITQDDGALHVWDGEQWNNVGEVKGPKGDTGFTGSIGYTGSEGPVGFTGSMGYTGSQGAGIIDVEIIGDDLVITYEDSSKKNLGRVVGYDGSGAGGGSIDGFTSNSIDTITLDAGYSIIPATDDQQDLGSLTNRFRDVYVGPGSLHLGNTVISSDEEDDLQVKDSAGAYRNVRLNNLVLGPTTTLPTNPTTGIVFANGTVQVTSAPRFYSDGYLYFDDLGNNRITAGDYLYDYINGTLFVTSFIPFNGWVTNRGVGYQPTEEFAILDNVEIIGGSGSGAEATVVVLFGEIFEILLTEQGTGYALGDSLSIDLNDGGSGFEVIVNSVDVNTGAISNGYLQLFDITVY